jgi:hypothetical protein
MDRPVWNPYLYVIWIKPNSGRCFCFVFGSHLVGRTGVLTEITQFLATILTSRKHEAFRDTRTLEWMRVRAVGWFYWINNACHVPRAADPQHLFRGQAGSSVHFALCLVSYKPLIIELYWELFWVWICSSFVFLRLNVTLTGCYYRTTDRIACVLDILKIFWI